MKKMLKKIYPLVQELVEHQEKANRAAFVILNVLNPKDDGNTTPKEPDTLPQYWDVQKVVDYLDIHPSNFYRNVYKKLLFPSLWIGRRAYYLRSDVVAIYTPHETGAHTYSKKKSG